MGTLFKPPPLSAFLFTLQVINGSFHFKLYRNQIRNSHVYVWTILQANVSDPSLVTKRRPANMDTDKVCKMYTLNVPAESVCLITVAVSYLSYLVTLLRGLE